jgi:hypothetical protein
MTIRNFLPAIYGVLIITSLYFIVKTMYSVYYTPGETVIYNSPQAQKLFAGNNKKLFPTWGYDKLGMYDGQPFKFGQGEFWPESGKGYVPNKFGSPGASPTGGMRPSFPIPAETPIGFWGYAPKPEQKVSIDIYDNTSIPQEYIGPVGWWGNDTF